MQYNIENDDVCFSSGNTIKMYVKLVTTTILFKIMLLRLNKKCVIAEQRKTNFKHIGHSISDCIYHCHIR